MSRLCSIHCAPRCLRGSANNWWLRSANSGNSNNFRNVNSDGTVNNNNANNQNGVAFGFYKQMRPTEARLSV